MEKRVASGLFETTSDMNRIFASAVIVVVTTSLSFAQGPGRGPSPVVVAEVIEDTVSPTQEFVGTVVPERRAVIGSAVDGRVDEFLVNEGDRVKAGQELAKLLMETISLEIAAAEAELEFRQLQLRELEAGNRPSEKEQATAMLAVSEAQLEEAQKKFERTRRLYVEAGAANATEFDQAKAELDVAAATVAERRAAKQLMDDGPREEKILQAKAQCQIQEAVVNKLRDQRKKHTIRSRFDGYVIAEGTEEGEWVNRGETIAEVAALDHVEILVHVLETYIPYIEVGMSVDVWIPTLAANVEETPDQPLRGEILRVIPEADSRSRTFPVKIRVKNHITEHGPAIKSGMLARVTLPIGPKKTTRLIPKDSLVLGRQKPSVWVLKRTNPSSPWIAASVEVTPQSYHRQSTAIGTELELGQLIVVEGNERLRPGAEVSILRKMDL